MFSGFRIPALTTRRTETELELNNGQTFAIAGLLNNSMTQTLAKVPGIGDIPILGYLFRSKAARKDQTELVVMITPQILEQGSFGVTNQLPRLQERICRGCRRTNRCRTAGTFHGDRKMIRLRHLRRDQRGASLLYITVGFMAFFAATALAIDVGMLMTARGQAQTAADAGACPGPSLWRSTTSTIAPPQGRPC